MATGQASWPEHQHEAVGHQHPHYHLTHNFIERVGGFEHLGYQHAHEHEHAAESHSHYPHEDFVTEHLGEAHEHEHAPGGETSASTAANAVKIVHGRLVLRPETVGRLALSVSLG